MYRFDAFWTDLEPKGRLEHPDLQSEIENRILEHLGIEYSVG